MVSQWLTTVSRWSAIPRAGPSSDDLVGASDECHRDRQAKSRELHLKLRVAGYGMRLGGRPSSHHSLPAGYALLRLADPSQITGNPKGCWDWWGYSGDKYLGRDGKQMRAVRAMIARMLP